MLCGKRLIFTKWSLFIYLFIYYLFIIYFYLVAVEGICPESGSVEVILFLFINRLHHAIVIRTLWN